MKGRIYVISFVTLVNMLLFYSNLRLLLVVTSNRVTNKMSSSPLDLTYLIYDTDFSNVLYNKMHCLFQIHRERKERQKLMEKVCLVPGTYQLGNFKITLLYFRI